MEIGQAIRQGDVLLVRVAALPQRVRRREPDALGRIIIEYGEATGHAHVLDPAHVAAYDVIGEAERIIGQAYLVLAATPLRHEEHGAVLLAPGVWERWYQVEDDGEEERRVAD